MKKHSFFKIMKNQSNLTIFIFVSLCICIVPTYASESYLTETKKESAKIIQTHIYQDNYTEAKIVADSLIAKDINDPIGYIFKAAVLLGEMTDREDNLYPIEFNDMIDKTMSLVDEKINGTDSNLVALYYLFQGHAYAYISMYESRFGSMTSALKNGFKAKSSYENGLSFDSSVYDLYGGLGMYHYWKSAKAGFLRWIHVVNDDKQKGIDELHLAIDSSAISSDAAKASLIWIYLDNDNYDTALVMAQDMYKKYPDGKTFLWAIARINYASGNYEKAIEVYQLLYDKLKLNRLNYYNILESEFQIYSAYLELGNEEKAKEIAKRCLYYVNKVPMDIRDRQRDKIEKLVKAATS